MRAVGYGQRREAKEKIAYTLRRRNIICRSLSVAVNGLTERRGARIETVQKQNCFVLLSETISLMIVPVVLYSVSIPRSFNIN
jgi:hypothetical protein